MAGFVDPEENQGDGGDLEGDGRGEKEIETEGDGKQAAQKGADRPHTFLGRIGDSDAEGQILPAAKFEHHVLGRHLEPTHAGADAHEGDNKSDQ